MSQGRRPVVAHGTPQDRLMASLGKELLRRRRTWPGEMSHALEEYFAPWYAKKRRERGMSHIPPPYWYVLPKLLWTRYRELGRVRSTTPSFLRDILLGQYCLFLSVRIQDDFLDGQAQSPVLVFVAHRLLIESREAFARHFPDGSPFWRLHDNSLRTTITGIFTAERIQQEPVLEPKVLLKEYARVASIFKMGMAAVCVKAGRMKDYARIAVCAERLAVFGQILDDLDDIAEDFARGRYNYCTSILVPRIRGRRPRRDDTLTLMKRSLLFNPASRHISHALYTQISSAIHATKPLGLPALTRYLALHADYADTVDRMLHQWNVGVIFPNGRRNERMEFGFGNDDHELREETQQIEDEFGIGNDDHELREETQQVEDEFGIGNYDHDF